MTITAGSFLFGLPWAFAQQPALRETQSPPISKEELRYASRSFSDWRRQLLTDLEPKTQVAAIEALLAFGKKGYEEGAVAAIGQVLSTATEQVQGAAFEALGQLGPTSVPVLIGALRDKNISVRVSAAATLARLGPAAQAALMRVGPKAAPAVPALTKFIAIDSPAREPSIVLAIDVLGSLGQSARQAVPALEAWLALGERPNVDLRTIHRHAVKALQSVTKP